MADDPVDQIKDNWDESMCVLGIVAYDYLLPLINVNYGIIIATQRSTYVPENIQAPYGAKHFLLYIVGHNDAEVDALATHLIYLFDSAIDMSLNSTYSRFWIDYDNAQFMKTINEIPINESVKRIAQCSMWASLREHAGHRLGEPRYSTRLGGES